MQIKQEKNLFNILKLLLTDPTHKKKHFTTYKID